jgi:glutaredoxin-dependent peroxiredoxin
MQKLIPGDTAPAFKLTSSDNKEVFLSDFRGKNVVILFFPFAYTGVCTQELCSIRDEKLNYDNANAEVLAISVDSPFTLAKFKEDQKLNFTLLSDFNKEAARSYGSLYEEFVLGLKGVAKRSAFLIDGDGIIKYAEVLENAGDIPNFAALNAVLNKL